MPYLIAAPEDAQATSVLTAGAGSSPDQSESMGAEWPWCSKDSLIMPMMSPFTSFLGSRSGHLSKASIAASTKSSLPVHSSLLPNLDMPAEMTATRGFPFKLVSSAITKRVESCLSSDIRDLCIYL